MSNSNNNGKLLGALLLGAAVGGALGILFAPDKGSNTRKKIIGKTDDLKESLTKKFNSILDEAQDEFEEASLKAIEIVENGKMKR